jgi:hypothetical protein
MLPAETNLPSAYRGDSYGPIIFKFYDLNNDPMNVTNADVECQVGNISEVRDREIVLSWPSTTHGISLSSNEITLEVVPPSAMKMSPGIYFYDLQVTLGGYTRTYLRGNLTVVDEVTNY